MTSFNVMAGGRAQVLVDEQQLQQLQAELSRRGNELERLKAAMETLGAVNTPAHFVAAAMALCNELASRWKAERVGIGFLKGRYVRLRALSHTEKITRSMQLVLDIESAMEECLDQDVEVLFPPPKDASFVYRAAESLAGQHGPNAVISLPLRRERKHLKERADERFGNVVAVLTLERKTDKPFNLQEIEALRLTCDLFTSRLMDLYEHDRWLGAKALIATRRSLAWAVGAKHTWAKVAAIAVAGFLAFAIFKDGMYRVEAPFEVQMMKKQIIAANIPSYLKSVNAEVNDVVFCPETAQAFTDLNSTLPLAPVVAVPVPKTVLAELSTTDLKSSLQKAEHDLQQALLNAKNKLPDDKKLGDVNIYLEEAESHRAEIQFYKHQIEMATITSPIDGIVTSGEMRTKIGIPVKESDELFQIGEGGIRAELSVPEDEISEIKKGSAGTLKATAFPDRPVHFTVERINPVATVSAGKNVFKVRATLDPAASAWMKPGVEGLSKTDVEKHKYGWIWTRRMVNWVRMKLWM